MKNNSTFRNKFNRRYIMALIVVGISGLLFFAPATLFFFFKEKIWAHRVNSIEKLAEAQSIYSGVEVDIIFDLTTHTFDVNHLPTPSIGLTLENYLGALKAPTIQNYWLDFKNLNTANQAAAFKRLEILTDSFQLAKERIIVESMQPELLTIFQQAGYLTSYYLPPNLHKMKPAKLKEKLNEIKDNLASHPELYISSFYKDYGIMKQHFPERKKLLWNLFYDIYPYRGQLYHMLMDEKVEVMLITFWAKEGNR